MTAVGHFATSAAAGLIVYQVTGSAVAAYAAGAASHPLWDQLFNEFWQWGADYVLPGNKFLYLVNKLCISATGSPLTREHVRMALYLVPAVAICVLALLACDGKGSEPWLVALLGTSGWLADGLDWLSMKLFDRHFLHWSPWCRMLSKLETAAIELAFGAILLITGLLVWKVGP